MIATINMTEKGNYQQTAIQIQSEMELVKAAQSDPRNFEPLYTAYYKRIVAYVYHRVESKEEAFEITAQVFYKALDNLSKYSDRGLPFSAWLFRIATNELNSLFRKNKNKRVVTLDDDCFTELQEEIGAASADHMDEHLYNALQQLETEEMELVNMRFFEKRAFKEISEITGMRESACKMKLYRILEQLKKKLTHF